jgi:hypothetical protein
LGARTLILTFAPARVVGLCCWSIAEDILISQLHPDFRGNVRKLLQPFHVEDAPAVISVTSLSSDGPASSSGDRLREPIWIKNSDRVELGVRFLSPTA